MKAKKPIGIIGFGNMGSAIAECLKKHYPIVVFDQSRRKTKGLRGIAEAKNLESLICRSEVIILAVKPQNFPGLLKKIKHSLSNKLLISIAAGVSTSYIQSHLKLARVIRVMPNLPAKVGAAMSCLCKGRFAKRADLKLAEKIFKRLGKTLIVAEKMVDAVTAVSGSGPGYLYAFLESESLAKGKISSSLLFKFKTDFTTAAERVGFTKKQTVFLVEATIKGSLKLLNSSRLTAAQLRRQVTSKNGTTEAGLKVLARGGSLTKAVQAARARARQLTKKR